MTKLEIAAQTWAKLELILTSSALPDDRLTTERPRCIAVIADALGAKRTKVAAPKPPPPPPPEPTPPPPPSDLPLIDFTKPVKQTRKPPVPHTGYLGPSSSLDSAITQKLEQYMRRSSMGYSADDEVGYERR